MATRSATPPAPRHDVQQQVVDWRLHVLVAAGYPPEVADKIARSGADLHQACDMLRSGCDAELAERILT